MSALSWLRATGKLIGIEQVSYPHLEALLEREASKPADDFFIAARVVPPVMAAVGLLFLAIGWGAHKPILDLFTGFFFVLGAVLGVVFNQIDRRITPQRKQLRKAIKKLWMRYRGFKNLIGFEKALAPSVGTVLDEAAAVYLRHARSDGERGSARPGLATRSEDAIESGMLQLMDLATPEDPALQEAELARGWPLQVLKEMQALDGAMQREDGMLTTHADARDALSRLREVRMEIEDLESAKIELDR